MDMNCAAIFVAVVDFGGFSAAARKLGIPKTTVSKKIGDLETELGIRLLNRTTRAISLTEAGARLHGHYREAFHHIDLGSREIQTLQSEPEGLLRIGAPSAIGVRFLLPIIVDLMARYPGLRISLVAVNDDTDRVDDQLDVLIWPGILRQAAHAVRLIARIDIGLYASQTYLAAHGTPKIPSGLERHRVVAFTQALVGGRFAWRLTSGRSTIQVLPEAPPLFLSNDAVAIMAAIAAGQGIGALPVGYASRSPEAASLVRILPRWHAAQTELNAFFRDGSSSSMKTRLFLDAVGCWFNDNDDG